MSTTLIDMGIDKMTPGERLHLIGEIWQSLPPKSFHPIPEAHRRELDRRTQAAIHHPEATALWSEVLERLR